MTWFANEVLVRGNQRALNAVLNDVRFAPFAYLIPPSCALPCVPDDGLVFIRPIYDTSDDDFAVEWYGEPILDWNSFPQSAKTALQIDPANVVTLCSCERKGLPPTSLLCYLKSFAAQTGSVVISYNCFMWGGDIEHEVVWVFNDSEAVLVSVPNGNSPSIRRTAILEPEQPVYFEQEDPLKLALQCMEVYLSSGYFKPHTRSFPWQQYKIGNTH